MRNNIIFENVRILYPNFSGEKSQFNADGKRKFTILIEDPNVASELLNQGWNIKQREEEDTESTYWLLEVEVKYDRYPPLVYAVRESGKLLLDETTINMLDYTRIAYADLEINPYHWTWLGKSGIKAFLKTGYFIIDETELDRRYASIPSIGG